MHTRHLPLLALSLAGLVACNAHPLEDSEMGNYTGINLDDGGDSDTDGEGMDDGAADGDGSGGEEDDGGSEVTCHGDEYEVAAHRPAVMLVLDKSGSMSDTWDTDQGEQTRWHSLHGVVSSLLDMHLESMTLGVSLFPDLGDNPGCGVPDGPVVPLADHDDVDAVLDPIPGADQETHGYTPMRFGLAVARDALNELPNDQPRAMVLVTDGVANCADPQDKGDFDPEVEEVVRAAYEEQGIATYVVGIGISHEEHDDAGVVPSEELAKVALAGGVAFSDDQPYYAVQSEDALDHALTEIADRVECTIQLAAPVGVGNTFEVSVGGEVSEQITDCSAEDGWRFTHEGTRSSIELCGSACGEFEIEGRVATETCGHDFPLTVEEPWIPPVP